MKEYLAKSNPKETIQAHTRKLIDNMKLLKGAYPNLRIDWDMLKWACIYHDLGKINRKFQKKILLGIKEKNEIPHAILSLPFINYEYFEKMGYSQEKIKILFQAVAYHHNREFNFNQKDLDKEIQELKSEFDDFEFDELNNVRILNDFIEDQYFVIDERTYGNQTEFFDYVMLKGLLNRLDYAASANIDVEIKNNFLIDRLKNLNYKWNDLQNFMIKNRDNNVIVVAQTGMGKTEAGLLWIGDNKGFFTLPLKSAINQIYNRIINKIVKNENSKLVGLLHSDTYSEYLKNSDEDIDEYFTKTKQLSLPLTVCTLDQLFDVVYRYRDFESKLATMSYSKIVIDEVQMYSEDLLAYLILGLSYINRIGGKFAILTATLPEIVVDLLKDKKLVGNIDFIRPEKPFINNELIRHSMMVVEEQISIDKVIEHYDNNKILVICNTVKKAQEIYNDLIDNEILNQKTNNINLLHGRFIKLHRAEKEEAIFNFAQLNNEEAGIWITTQVVEASLDIDFDMLFTELSDVNGLFQRMGRCNRKGKRKINNYNCFVFTGGDKKTTGVGNFIDRDIFDLSKKVLINIKGALTEQMKLDMIGQIYTMEKLKDTEYYRKLVRTLEYVKTFNEYELKKSEVKKMFRNINNVTVIPEQIYIENKEMIDECLREIKINSSKDNKYEAREKLLSYTAELNYRDVSKSDIVEEIEISKFERVQVIQCKYSKEVGVCLEKTKDSEISNTTNII